MTHVIIIAGAVVLYLLVGFTAAALVLRDYEAGPGDMPEEILSFLVAIFWVLFAPFVLFWKYYDFVKGVVVSK